MTEKRHRPPRTGLADQTQINEPAYARAILADTHFALLWLLARVYVGAQWLRAGWLKLVDPDGGWVGARAGSAIIEQVTLATRQVAGPGAGPARWYAAFLEHIVLPNAAIVAYVLTIGEILLGLAAIVGLFTGLTAFFGGALHAPYLLPGDPSTMVVATLLVLGWRVAGYYGLDRWLMPLVGVPGYPGTLFRVTCPPPGAEEAPVVT